MLQHVNAKISELRIISGKFRSRKIFFFKETDLRPTHNRIRETVFHWLSPVIENSVCLDAFSGSGALGFEALSQYARQVVFCDISKTAIENLKKNAEILQIQNATFLQQDFLQQNTITQKFDIVFLDPPFQHNILLTACVLLESKHLLNPDAKIYLEYQKASVDLSQLPKNWVIEKHKSTKTIEYVLCIRA